MGITSKTGFHDWFINASEYTRRHAIIYTHDGLGPMRNESDKDLVPYFGYLIGMHFSSAIDSDKKDREDVIYLSAEPEYKEMLRSELLKDCGIRRAREWLDVFEEFKIDSHPVKVRILRDIDPYNIKRK